MITLDEAKNKILLANPNTKILDGFEFADIYAFSLIANSADENAPVGGGYYAIDKDTGNIFGMSSAQVVFREGGRKIAPKELN